MNKFHAKIIAETITNDQLLQMFENAKQGVIDWEKVSTVNNGFTKGAVWNLLAVNFDMSYNYQNIAKINMIREFGEFLPDHLKIQKAPPKKKSDLYHEDPIL